MTNKSGKNHWILQRLSAVLLFILLPMAGFLAYINRHNNIDQWRHILKKPFYIIILIILMVVATYHAALGFQSIIEDYIPNKKAQKACIICSNGLFLVMLITTLFFIYKIVRF